MKCPICLTESNDFKEIVAISKWPPPKKLLRHECSNCGVIFGTQEMLNLTLKELGKKYEKLYESGYRDCDNTKKEIELIKNCRLPRGSNCLNWGGGSVNNTFKSAKNMGISLWNFEPFDLSAKKANLITDKNKLKKYNAVISNDVLEHFQDPVAALIEMKQYLKPKGKMIHGSTCYQYKFEFSPFHLFFFTGNSIAAMAERAGLAYKILNKRMVKFWPK